MDKEISQELQNAIKSIIDEFDLDEQAVRQRQIRLWKKLEYFWAGITRIWYDETAHDWRIYQYRDEQEGDDGYYDKSINVYRAYLETLIAALSATVPAIKAKPDDAENLSDVLTAKGATNIAKLVYEHIKAPLLWTRALFLYCSYGMVAAYTYTIEDKKFGTVKVAEFKDFEEDQESYVCPTCGNPIDPNAQIEKDEFDPGPEDVLLENIQEQTGSVLCSNCQQLIDPELRVQKVVVNRQVGEIDKPKARQQIEVLGGLYVKVPNYARMQEETPYVAYEYETHYSNIYKKWPHLRDKLKNIGSKISSSSGNDIYERWGRLNPQYYGEYPKDTPTVRMWWLRPSAFECINEESLREEAYKAFPDGVKYCLVNDTFAEAKNECLDDHWTLTWNPLSEYIHFDPLGLLLTSIQEITTDMVSLTLQTIEHGIPQTFADPSVLSFREYGLAEVRPGDIYSAKPKSGKSLGESFHQISTATLSPEVDLFGNKIQEMGQFVSGALPSLFGGNQANSSRTAAQYSMSRNQALQRLQTPWKMFNYWWEDIFGKVIPAYIKNMLDDERIVQEVHNNFINITIKQAELNGKLGSIEVESSQELPLTWGQQRDIFINLLQGGNPEILTALFSPENISSARDLLGLDDFEFPGEADREKQIEEISILASTEPLGNESVIMPEMMVDNHQVHAEVCRNWLVSEAGRQAKAENPNGYKNVLLHLQAHIMMLQTLTQPAPAPQQQQGNSKLRPLQRPTAQGE